MAKMEKILVAIDFSPSCKAALDYGWTLAKKVGAKMDVLHIASPDKVRGGDDVSILTRGVPGSTLEAYSEEEIQAKLNTFMREAGIDRDVRNDEIEESKDPAQMIVQLAKERGYDLVVLGSHGRKGLMGRIAGSVTEKVIQGAPCPVTICRAN